MTCEDSILSEKPTKIWKKIATVVVAVYINLHVPLCQEQEIGFYYRTMLMLYGQTPDWDTVGVGGNDLNGVDICLS